MPLLSRLTSIALLCGTCTMALAEPWDGPYVGRDPANQWIALWVEAQGDRLEARRQKVSFGDEIEVPAVGSRPSFEVRLRDSTHAVPDIVPLSKSTPMFVVADTHGEFEIATELLLRHRIIDDKLSWSFGTGHLVLLGDVFDRGERHTELLWLIYKLEAEAQAAGGGVHLILGNHETMVLLGDERYLNAKYLRTPRVLNAPGYAALWGTNTVLGRWLRTKASVMKIGEYACLHGGLSPEVVSRKLTLQAMNSAIRDALHSRHALPQPEADNLTFIMGQNGPLWHRGYFTDAHSQGGAAQVTAEEVESILKYFKADKILIGHTRVPTITSLYDGKVIAVQVYPHRDDMSGAPVMEALAIRDRELFRASVDGSLEPLEKRPESDSSQNQTEQPSER
jgi:hypothetical protein